MSDETETVLPVELMIWHWGMDRRRVGLRRRIEGDIAVRWLRRFVARSASTVTRAPMVALPEGCQDHWIMNQPCLVLNAWLVLGGRLFGLPEQLMTDAQAIAIPAPGSLRRPEVWDRILDDLS